MRIFRLAAVGGTLVGLLSIGSIALGTTRPAGGTIRAFVSNATVSNGSGLYKGISGTLKATVTFAFIGRKKNGKCNMNGKPAAQYSSVVVSRNVRF
jgi:hypothetical protein